MPNCSRTRAYMPVVCAHMTAAAADSEGSEMPRPAASAPISIFQPWPARSAPPIDREWTSAKRAGTRGGNTAPSIGIIRTGTKGLSQHVLPERRNEYPCAKAKYRACRRIRRARRVLRRGSHPRPAWARAGAGRDEGWYYRFTFRFSMRRQCLSGSVHFSNETPGGQSNRRA